MSIKSRQFKFGFYLKKKRRKEILFVTLNQLADQSLVLKSEIFIWHRNFFDMAAFF